tara:strand:+ start:2341 stop:3777 length:1437 start_codon:yes stop_codon:yes gene_type:complete
MKISLIYAPVHGNINSAISHSLNKRHGIYPPLGLLYIASALEEEHDVSVLDLNAAGTGKEGLIRFLRKENPEVVGMSTTSFTFHHSLRVATLIKEFNKNIKIILGGPHTNYYPSETLSHEEFDILIRGEGEVTVVELARELEKKGNLREVEGISYKDENEKVVHNPNRKLIENLDEIKFPAKHLINNRDYYTIVAKGFPFTTMLTSRGCPYNCLMCDQPFGSKFRMRSAGNVVDEIEQCMDKFNIKEFFMYDDTFTLSKKRTLEICKEIKDRKLDIIWDIRARVDTLDEESIRALAGAGCGRAYYGVEAGDEKILKILRKNITIEQAKKIVGLSKKYGMDTFCYYMIGSPEETEATIKKTIEASKYIDSDYAVFQLTTPHPHTDLYDLAFKKGLMKEDYWAKYTLAKKEPTELCPIFETEELTREKLEKLTVQATKEFYLRPSYILKRLLKLKNLKEFKNHVNGAIGTIFLKHRLKSS